MQANSPLSLFGEREGKDLVAGFLKLTRQARDHNVANLNKRSHYIVS